MFRNIAIVKLRKKRRYSMPSSRIAEFVDSGMRMILSDSLSEIPYSQEMLESAYSLTQRSQKNLK